MDQQLYAIKKTVLKVPNHCTASVKDEMRRMLQEVRLFAAISNPHIIRYNHSWIEVTECPTDLAVENVTESPEEPAAEASIELESPFIEFAASPSGGPRKGPNNSSRRENSRRDSEERVEEGKKKMLKISLFIQMELCAETLEDYLNRRTGPMTEEEFRERINIASQMIDAIYAIHSDYKIIHRDLSLRNIFIGKDGVIKIGDFGLATKSRHLIPILASPFVLKPIEPLPEEALDSFKLSSGSGPEEEIENEDGENSSADHPEDLEESEPELTHGVGTKTFAAPEQMSNLPYDQKADIYSLGLILLVLFSPTQTLSERYEIIRRCRQSGPSAEFYAKFPELAVLIKRMTSENPLVRPSAIELKESALFKLEPKPEGEWEKLGLNGKKCLVKVGTSGKCKTKYVKISGGNLFLYAKKTDQKAKLCYPLTECKIVPPEDNVSKTVSTIRRNRSTNNFLEDVVPAGFAYKVSVEHPQLETLHFFVQNASMCSVT